MSQSKIVLSVEYLNEVEEAAHKVRLAEGKVTLRMFDLGEVVERRPEGTTLEDVSEQVWRHARVAAKQQGRSDWKDTPRPEGTTVSNLSKAGTTYREWVVEQGFSPQKLRFWSFDMLYQWRPSAVGLDASEILSEVRTAPPKEEEIAADSPKAKQIRKRRDKAVKAAAKQQKRQGKAAKQPEAKAEVQAPTAAPKVPDAKVAGPAPKGQPGDVHKVILSDDTFRRLVAIRETDRKAFRNLDAVVATLLDMAEAMSKASDEGDTAGMAAALPKGVLLAMVHNMESAKA